MTAILDLTFQHESKVEVLEELPGAPGSRCIYYPGAREDGGKSGLIIRVHPRARPAWVGVFASLGVVGLSGVFSCPRRNQLLVVACGTGYLVQADAPTVWSPLSMAHVRDVRAVPDRQILLLVGEVNLEALGPTGTVWLTPRLASDGVEVVSLDRDRVIGRGWDAAANAHVGFTVGLADGAAEGGWREPV
jgi:hypothetical protein